MGSGATSKAGVSQDCTGKSRPGPATRPSPGQCRAPVHEESPHRVRGLRGGLLPWVADSRHSPLHPRAAGIRPPGPAPLRGHWATPAFSPTRPSSRVLSAPTPTGRGPALPERVTVGRHPEAPAHCPPRGRHSGAGSQARSGSAAPGRPSPPEGKVWKGTLLDGHWWRARPRGKLWKRNRLTQACAPELAVDRRPRGRATRAATNSRPSHCPQGDTELIPHPPHQVTSPVARGPRLGTGRRPPPEA